MLYKDLGAKREWKTNSTFDDLGQMPTKKQDGLGAVGGSLKGGQPK